jgi:CTP-dependent riboflavin kinase
MNYQLIYDKLIQKVKLENRKKLKRSNPDYKYYENHHIIPRSMGGNNTAANMIKLTAKEHYVAHHLLWKIYKNQSMACAFWNMCNTRKNGNARITSRTYESIRNEISLNAQKRMADPAAREHLRIINTGHIVTNETREKISKANTGKIQTQDSIALRSASIRARSRRTLEEIHGEERAAELREIRRQNSTGRKQSEETIAKRVEKLEGHECTEKTREKISKANSGKTRTDEQRKNISEGHKGTIQTEEANIKRSKAMTGKKKSEETKEKMRKPKSEEHKRKISETKRRKVMEKVKSNKNPIKIIGIIESGCGDMAPRLTKNYQVFKDTIGKFYCGTINVRIDKELKISEDFRITKDKIIESNDTTEQDYLLEFCKINEYPAYRIRPFDINGAGGHGDNILEIIASVKLENIIKGNSVIIELF